MSILYNPRVRKTATKKNTDGETSETRNTIGKVSDVSLATDKTELLKRQRQISIGQVKNHR